MVSLAKTLIFAGMYKVAAGQDALSSVEDMLWFGDKKNTLEDFTGNQQISPARQRVIQIAKSQIGQGKGDEWKKYLEGTVPYLPETKQSWCGIFVTWVLQQAGLTTKQWEYGSGISSILQRTDSPKPGDIIYLNEKQHHGIIESINGNDIKTVDGNSWNGVVAENDRKLSDVAAFYSIAPLIGEKA